MYHPETLAEALDRLALEPGRWRPLAGGTDLMVLLQAGKLEDRFFLSIWGLGELVGITSSQEEVILGCLTTYTEVLGMRCCVASFPAGRGCSRNGCRRHSKPGHAGGQHANASPAADTPPVLLAYDAEVELTSVRGSRWMPYRES